MTSSRPYLIRALFQWIVDNGLSPHLLVKADHDDVVVPEKYIKDNKIVLNISPVAVHGLTLGDEDISFNARFSGKPMDLFIPIESVLAIYAHENGQGMMFSDEEDNGPGLPPGEDTDKDSTKPTLRVVK